MEGGNQLPRPVGAPGSATLRLLGRPRRLARESPSGSAASLGNLRQAPPPRSGISVRPRRLARESPSSPASSLGNLRQAPPPCSGISVRPRLLARECPRRGWGRVSDRARAPRSPLPLSRRGARPRAWARDSLSSRLPVNADLAQPSARSPRRSAAARASRLHGNPRAAAPGGRLKAGSARVGLMVSEEIRYVSVSRRGHSGRLHRCLERRRQPSGQEGR
ncbi:uncharacterized protein [Narcine bancroftii]|uniref:uncharacterized protein n=1 Tax=Narcine bancroftii TaxID=1343680 RepID=UPI0038311535